MIPKYFRRGTRPHVLLLIAKSQKTWFSWETAFKISNKFKDRKRTREAGQCLVRRGLVEVEYRGQFRDAYWRITDQGSKYLVAFAARYPSRYAL